MSGAGPGFGLGAAELALLGPFHLVVDRELRVVQTGDVLARLQPTVAERPRLTEVFRIRRPRHVRDFAGLCAAAAAAGGNRGRLALLAARSDERLTLKGQFVALPGGDHLLFFGTPVAHDLEALAALGLTLSDFAAHDGIADFLLVMRSQATSLAEARTLAESLRALNAELEDRVEERTRRLHRIEEDLRLAQKLEAVGQLAAGVAHEINTPVQFVGSNLSFLTEVLEQVGRLVAAYRDLEDAADRAGGDVAAVAAGVRDLATEVELDYLLEEGRRATGESLEGVDRVRGIVRAMRDFAHPDRQELAPTDLNACILTTLTVSRNEYRDVADVVTELDPALPAVPAIAGEINQVLLNLVVNAAHAIGERAAGGRGRVVIRSEADADEVRLTVVDDGDGIPPDVQPRIFDPFFTTKEVGRGTGQGLSTSRAIVTQRHSGRLTFDTRPGRTAFTVALPRHPRDHATVP